MKITITRDAGTMLVDRVARPVDVSQLPPGVEVVHWNTEMQRGFVQYDEDTTVEINERDLEAEEETNRQLRANNKQILQEPLYKKIRVHKSSDILLDFSPYMPLYNQWESYVPPPPPPIDPTVQAQLDAVAGDRSDARNQTLGTVTPMTVDQLQAMSRAELRTWFDTNVTNANQLIKLVKWMFVFFIRRLL